MKKNDLFILASAVSTICAVITMCIFFFGKGKNKKNELLSAAMVLTSFSDLMIGIGNYIQSREK